MPIVISPIAVAHAASFHSCLDTVAREKQYLAQVEALPLDKIETFVRENVANDSVQFVALDGARVVGWADIFPAWPYAVSHCGTLGMGSIATTVAGVEVKLCFGRVSPRLKPKASRALNWRYGQTTGPPSGSMRSWVSFMRH
jgi:hypothetical protein